MKNKLLAMMLVAAGSAFAQDPYAGAPPAGYDPSMTGQVGAYDPNAGAYPAQYPAPAPNYGAPAYGAPAPGYAPGYGAPVCGPGSVWVDG